MPSVINGTGPSAEPPEANSLWVFCGLGGADALLEGLSGDALLGGVLLGEVLTGGGLLGATLVAATLPLVP